MSALDRAAIPPRRRPVMDEMRVDVPEGSSGPWSIERFTVTDADRIGQLGALFSTGRSVPPGTYTGLYRGQCVVMSDTPDELRDHLEPAWRIRAGAERVLIAGLGLGCLLNLALRTETVREVDVVDLSPDVISLSGPHYEKAAADAGVDLRIHEASIFDVRWPTGTRWDVAWFDIWDTICEDNRDDFTRLGRSYGRRAAWKGCWSKPYLDRLRRQARDGLGW